MDLRVPVFLLHFIPLFGGCPLHHYFDPDTVKCEGCDKLCHQAEVRGKEKQCRELCPVESPLPVSKDSLMAPSTERPMQKRLDDRRTPMTIIPLLAAVCTVAVISVFVLTNGHRKLHTYLCVNKLKSRESDVVDDGSLQPRSPITAGSVQST